MKQEQKKPVKQTRPKTETAPLSGKLSEGKKKKLEELDNFIEDVLQKAGEDFLEEFKQIEGE